MLGLHHLHARKRLYNNLEQYPSRSFLKYLLDRAMYGVAIITPLALLPQALQVHSLQSADGLALSTWILLTGVNLMWALYGYVHREIPIIIANVALMILHAFIIYGIVLYS